MKSALFSKQAEHQPLHSMHEYEEKVEPNDPALVNTPKHVAERMELYRSIVLERAMESDAWTFEPVGPELLVQWLLPCPEWKTERANYFPLTKQRIFNELLTELLNFQGHITGADQDALKEPKTASAQTESPAFRAWFAGSKVVDARGNPLVCYHGTNEEFDTFKATPDAHFGFHFGTAAAANDRLQDTRKDVDDPRRGAKAQPLMDEDASERLRGKLRDKEKALSARRTKIYTEALARNTYKDTPEYLQEMRAATASGDGDALSAAMAKCGAQFTPEEQAELKQIDKDMIELNHEWHIPSGTIMPGERVMPVYLRIKNPIRMKDCNWGDAVLILRYNHNLGLKAKTLGALRKELEAQGYDGVVYRNEAEDMNSDSYIVFHPEQIKSATGNSGAFDPAQKSIAASDRKAKKTLSFQGFSIAIEYPAGSTRKGTSPEGVDWEREMTYHYGHLKGHDGADGDSMDCYVGTDDTAEHAYIVNQFKGDGSFDEHKVLLGFGSMQEALAGYLENMPEDWTRFGPLRVMTLPEFRFWLQGGGVTKMANDDIEVWPSAWIDPKGEVHECETHEEFAGTQVGPEDQHYPQGGLLRQGWIRIGEYEDNCYAECYRWTTRALAMTQVAFQANPKFRGENIIVDTGQPGSSMEIPYAEFMAMNKPTEFRRYKFANEADGIGSGEHAYIVNQFKGEGIEKIAGMKFRERAWITPDGRTLPVEGVFETGVSDPTKTEHHHNVIERELGITGDPEGINDAAMVQGWIRIGMYDRGGYVLLETCTRTQFKALWDWVAKMQPGMIAFDGAVMGSIPADDFLKCSNINDLRRELRGTKVAGEAPKITEENGDVTVSLGGSEVSVHLKLDRAQAIVDTLFVVPALRNQGVGSLLMKTLVEWLKDHGVMYLTGIDASEFGQSTKIRMKLPGKSVLFTRNNEGDGGGDAAFPEAPDSLKAILKGLTPDDQGRIMVTKIAKLLRRIASESDGIGSGEHAATTDETGQFWGDAGAGCVFYAQDTGRLLVSFRSAFVNEPHTWGVWGGAIDQGENPRSAALREVREETGYEGTVQLRQAYVYTNGKFKYTTFLAVVPKEFVPTLDWETEDFQWAEADKLPKPLHFGLKEALPGIKSIVDSMRQPEAKTAATIDDGTYSMPVEEAIDEHTKLVRTLESADPDALQDEAEEQGAELHEMRLKANYSMAKSASVWRKAVEELAVPVIEDFYQIATDAMKDDVKTFDSFLAKLQTGLGSNWPAFLHAAGGYTGLRPIWDAVTEHDIDDLAQSMEDMRVSPRLPSAAELWHGKPRTVPLEDPHAAVKLQPDLKTMSTDMDALKFNVSLMLQYPEFQGISKRLGPVKQAEAIIEHMTDNLVWLYNMWHKEHVERSKSWYIGGNRITHRWAKRFNCAPQAVAGVLASLSPQQHWFQNVTLAERVLSALTEHADEPWDDAMTNVILTRDWGKGKKEKSEDPDEEEPESEEPETETVGKIKAKPYDLLPRLKGKTLQDLEAVGGAMGTYLQALWIRAYDEAHNPNGCRNVSPEGEFGDWYRAGNGEPVKNRWNSFNEVMKAVNVYKDPSVKNISNVVGANHKVRSFYNNLIAPLSNGGDVTIDTHAVAAALVRPLSAASIPVAHNFGSGKAAQKAKEYRPAGVDPVTGKKIKEREATPYVPAVKGPTSSNITGITGLYGFYAEAYRRAAKQVGIQPREMQSITWEAVRGLFKPGQKRDKNFVAQADAHWKDYSNGIHDKQATRDRLLELAGGIESPSWSLPNPANSAGERHSSYSGQLPSPVGPGGKPKKPAKPRGGAGAAGGAEAGVGAEKRRGVASLFQKQARASQWDTPEFKAWFGDSKIVDKQGNPLVLYRGIAREPQGMPPGAMRCEPRPGYAVFCTDNPHVASTYGDAVVPVYVKADQLIEFPTHNGSFSFCGFDDRAKSLAPGQVLVVRQVVDPGPRNREADTEKLYSYRSDIYAFGQGTQVKSAIGNDGTFGTDTSRFNYSMTAGKHQGLSGFHVDDSERPWTELILSGKKTIETRNSLSLNPHVGERVGIVRTHQGPATLVGYCDLGAPVVYHNNQEFRADQARHQVPQGSGYDLPPGAVKYGYPLSNVERCEPQPLPSRGPGIGRVFRALTPVQAKLFQKNAQVVFHGTPHEFDEFKTEHIGTGEGNAAYGWGLYFTGSQGIAEYYRDTLSVPIKKRQLTPSDFTLHLNKEIPASWRKALMNAAAFAAGSELDVARAKRSVEDSERLWRTLKIYNPGIAAKLRPEDFSITMKAGLIYEVEIPDDGAYLLWDTSLSQQPEMVKMLTKIQSPIVQEMLQPMERGNTAGSAIYMGLAQELGKEGASRALRALGIRGIKYLDGSSRAMGGGGFNYVIFDDKDVRVVQKKTARLFRIS